MGLEPGTTKDDIRKCLERWNEGDNGILDLLQGLPPQARHRLADPAGVLHAPGSLVTYEPQWGSDVFGMYQSMVEGRRVPWELLVKDVPEDKHHDLDYIVDQLDWEKNVDRALQGPQLPRADRPLRRRGPGPRRQVDRLRHTSTASSSSAPAS